MVRIGILSESGTSNAAWWNNIHFHLLNEAHDLSDHKEIYSCREKLLASFSAKECFYTNESPSWVVEFENDEDATAFLLKWS